MLFALFALAASSSPGARLDRPQRARGGTAAPYLVLGPMVGHTTSTNTRIWADASGPARLSVRIGLKEDLSDSREVKGPRLEVASAFMGQIQIDGLSAQQRYFYSILLNGRPAMNRPYPSVMTAPPEGTPGRVRFAFVSCVGYFGYDSAASWADMAMRTNFDLLLMLGDNHYANSPEPDKQRVAFFDQRRSGGYRDLSSRTPTYAIWDDHDFGPDNSDGTLPGKERALKTFQEHWANPSYGEALNPGVYFKLSRGAIDFFMLDDRFHRSPNRATNLAEKTMLGAAQLAWLKRELLASQAPVKILAAGGEWESHGTDDSWTSFQRERDDIFKFIEDHAISGVILISGDRHFTAAYQVQGKWIEVTTGPVGSQNSDSKNLPEMFLNCGATKNKMYTVFDIDTGSSPPAVTLEVYRVGEGRIERRPFTWDEILGRTKVKPLPSPPAKSAGSKPPAAPAAAKTQQ